MRYLCTLAILLPTLFTSSVQAGDFSTRGIVGLTDLQPALSFDGSSTARYVGRSFSRQIGFNFQTGTILPDPTTVDNSRLESEGILTFEGDQGPNPFYRNRRLHVIYTRYGRIHCTWHAVFTAQFFPDGTAILKGDGEFTIVGGTGRFRNASGRFQTLFETLPIQATANSALARFTQSGTLNRR